MTPTPRRLVAWLTAVVALTAVPAARAGISFVDQFRSRFSTQTGDGPTLTENGYNFATRLYASAPNFYTAVTMSGPVAGATLAVDPSNPTVYAFSSSLYPTQAAMEAAYPTGTYRYLATTASGPDSTSLLVSSFAYPQSTPYLAGTTYSSLQGMNAGQSFHFSFSPFTTGPSVNESLIFFTLYDATSGASVFDAGPLASTTTGLDLAAGTLMAGHQYNYTLIFSNRNLVDTTNTTFAAQLGFDYRTSGTFTTAAAVPEPSSFALAALGSIGVILAGRARRRHSAE